MVRRLLGKPEGEAATGLSQSHVPGTNDCGNERQGLLADFPEQHHYQFHAGTPSESDGYPDIPTTSLQEGTAAQPRIPGSNRVGSRFSSSSSPFSPGASSSSSAATSSQRSAAEPLTPLQVVQYKPTRSQVAQGSKAATPIQTGKARVKRRTSRGVASRSDVMRTDMVSHHWIDVPSFPPFPF